MVLSGGLLIICGIGLVILRTTHEGKSIDQVISPLITLGGIWVSPVCSQGIKALGQDGRNDNRSEGPDGPEI